ncbi:MAG: peptidylprolyl isomerase, partial [Bacteroidetes bacterium]|nr:peptidylprolyl isomerase [Bacteroidota bacterium]
MRKLSVLLILTTFSIISFSQKEIKIKKKDRRRDIELVTNYGNIVLRLYDSTPLHRDNFIRLVKTGYYDSVLFHRVINHFMIQSGDPDSKHAEPGQP